MADQEITRDAVRALIADVFEHHPMPALLKVETQAGLVVRFVVLSKRLGGILCEYPVEPMAESLLRTYPNATSAAYSMLTIILLRLPLGLHVGMENVCDTAEVETIDADAEVRALIVNGGKPVENKQRRKRRQDTLKKMEARNHMLISPPRPGPQAEVTPSGVTGAIGILAGMGKSRAEVTPQAVADLLGYSERAVYKALEKSGATFEDLLNM